MIKAVISDFDGTLVDTFEANFQAYCQAFREAGKSLSRDRYTECFGLRFDAFMQRMDVVDEGTAFRIRESKRACYPSFFHCFRLNRTLVHFVSSLHNSGYKTAIASTASRENLMDALDYLGIVGNFDLIFSGVDVARGKPDPEIYLRTMERMGVSPEETLIFEDSDIGVAAAEACGAGYIRVTPDWFEQQ